MLQRYYIRGLLAGSVKDDARLIALLLTLAWTGAAWAQTPRVLDAFEDIRPWEPISSDAVNAAKRIRAWHEGQALRLDFDFSGVSGHAGVRRALPIVFPENYEISFWMRADAPVNTFEVKLVDASGEKVWWRQRQNITFPKQWTQVPSEARDRLAWGPDDRPHAPRTEKMSSSSCGQGGGKGSIDTTSLSIRALPAGTGDPARAVGGGDGSLTGFPGTMAVDATRDRLARGEVERRACRWT